ncbi:MAG: TonB-dependent receptor [Tannerella sp.]|jgi:outer membrane receptor protein involved in Fe transport|nr:TonB-dependent receptor [Tannerella sp.]
MTKGYGTIFSFHVFAALLFIHSASVYSQSLGGVVTDAKTQETLPGVNIVVKNTTNGTVSRADGVYELKLPAGKYTVAASYVSYATLEVVDVEVDAERPTVLNLTLKESIKDIEEVVVVGRKNMEAEYMLMMERRQATVALENIGAKEMSVKGLSTVADGVKKITGISMEGGSKVYVRGLGDRYSMTSLNGFPIASPNPDHKLIPLTLFPTSVVKNISVSKVYQPSVFGDYSGAHINVETKEHIGNDYVTFSLSTGGKTNTLFADFYSSDKGSPGRFIFPVVGKRLNLPGKIKHMHTDEFETYQRERNPFKTSFSIHKSRVLPELGLDFGIGKSRRLGSHKINALFAVSFDNDYTVQDDAYISTINAQGVVRDRYHFNKYGYETTATLLGRIHYSFRKTGGLSYNILFVNNTEDDYRERDGFDAEGVDLKGSNSVLHIYSLFNNQLTGRHDFLKERLNASWQLSYGKTGSDEPDRRQVMFTKNSDGSLSLFKLNQQETMRYFGELKEDEWNGDVKLTYKLNDGESPDFVRAGFSLRDKSRNFYSSNFYYNLRNMSPEIEDIYDTDHFLHYENIRNGVITINKNSQPRNKYFAESGIWAAFVDFEYYPAETFLLSAGVRYEHLQQRVRYWTDAAEEKRARLESNDFFPALNAKYTIRKNRNIRLGLSRTVTRPSFIEMAPFEYKESYGGATVRGNAGIKNGYNYNIDVRYEAFQGFGNMFSFGLYYKYLDSPIERVQDYAGSLIQSFRNVNEGHVAGAEIEFRRHLTKHFKLDFNASYIYTHISLSENGIYTDKSRKLQGASPYLMNLDLNYSTKFMQHKGLFVSAVYNLQGPRIGSVGINGVSNTIEQSFHSFDLIGSYSLNDRAGIKLQAKNLLNRRQEFTQKIKATGKEEVVGYYRKGLSLQLGISMNF